MLCIVKIYKYLLAPFFPNACRYTPTCANYAEQALKKHGFLKGLWLTIRRLSRCHPWGGSGYDPVP